MKPLLTVSDMETFLMHFCFKDVWWICQFWWFRNLNIIKCCSYSEMLKQGHWSLLLVIDCTLKCLWHFVITHWVSPVTCLCKHAQHTYIPACCGKYACESHPPPNSNGTMSAHVKKKPNLLSFHHNVVKDFQLKKIKKIIWLFKTFLLQSFLILVYIP